MKKISLLLIFLISTLCLAGVLPSSANGKLVQEFVDAFNAGEAGMRTYYEVHPGPPIDERLERYRRMKNDFGTLTPLRFVREETDSLEFVARTADGRDLGITVMIGGEKPEIRGFRINAGGEAPNEPPKSNLAPGAPIDEQSALHGIQDLVAAKAKGGSFSGTVLIARNNNVLWQGVYGLANREKNVPVQPDTRFDIGSIAKAFTRVAIGQLLEQGTLKLTDKVGQFLPDYPNPTVREQVTIQQLLDMRSGIGDFFGEKLEKTSKQNMRTLRDYLPLFAKLTESVKGRRTVFYNSKNIPDLHGCTLRRFETDAKTNWHYLCANAFLDGLVRLAAGVECPPFHCTLGELRAN